MGTSCNIYVETSPGNYMGTYCHFDGYEKHMLQAVGFVTHEYVYGEILRAGFQSGFRVFDPIGTGEEAGGVEYLGERRPCFLYAPDTDGDFHGVHYIYIKYADGTIKWRSNFDCGGGSEPEKDWQWFTPSHDVL